jgi:ADP-ribose pyrophosphatase
MRERVLSSRVVFEGQILTLRVDDIEASDGHHSTREVVATRGAVGIVCIHDGQLVLTRQYRHAVGEVLLEIPAGMVDPGEDPAETAARELVEEVGLRPRSIEHLVTFLPSPGFTDHKLHLYLTDDVVPEQGSLDEGEVIEIERRPVTAVRELLSSGEVRDAKTLLGLALLALRA